MPNSYYVPPVNAWEAYQAGTSGYDQGQQNSANRTLAEIFKSANPDYNGAAAKLAGLGKYDTALALLKLGQDAASTAEVAGMFPVGGGGVLSSTVAVPQAQINQSPIAPAPPEIRPSPENPMGRAGGAVPATNRVVGDQEAINSGLYDAPKRPTTPSFNDRYGAFPTQSNLSAPEQPPPPPPTRAAAPSLDARTAVTSDPEIVGLQTRMDNATAAMARTKSQSAKDALKIRIEAWGKELEKRIEGAEKSRSDVVNPGIKIATDRLDASSKEADTAIKTIDSLHDLRSQLDAAGGVFTGLGSNYKLWLSKFGKALGVGEVDPNTITNTETYLSAVGKQVAQQVKQFGSGNGISEGDRRYAEKIAAGDITLDESSIRNLFSIYETAARNAIKDHQKKVDKYSKLSPHLAPIAEQFRVETPRDYVAPQRQAPAAPPPTQQAAQGGSRPQFRSLGEVQEQVDRGALKRGDTFLDPNGVLRRVP